MWWSSTSTLPTAIPVIVNFMPSWWHINYGMAFGERVFADWRHRAALLRDMHREAHARLSHLGFGDPDPELEYVSDDLNNATIPAALGCEVVFAEDKYPAPRPLPERDARTIQVPTDISRVYPMNEVIRQTVAMSAESGRAILPVWSYMGVQNIASLVRGADLYSDYYQDPELAMRLLEVARGMMEASIRYFADTAHALGCVWNQNCTVPLGGPGIYEQFLLQHDRALRRFAHSLGAPYAIHHCGCFDDYTELYGQVGAVAVFDAGHTSDLRAALNAFPAARFQHLLDCVWLREATPAQVSEGIGALLDEVGEDAARVTFVLSDLDHGTPDATIEAVVHALLQ